MILLLLLAVSCTPSPFILNSLVKSKGKTKIDGKKKLKHNEQNHTKKIHKTKANSSHLSSKALKKGSLSLTNILSITPFVALATSMLISYKVKINEKPIKTIIRVSFAIYMIITQLVVFLLRSRIEEANDQTILTIIDPNPMQRADLPPPEPVQITTQNYDLKIVSKMSSGIITESGLAFVMHFYQKTTQSLVFSLLMGISNLIGKKRLYTHRHTYSMLTHILIPLFRYTFYYHPTYTYTIYSYSLVYLYTYVYTGNQLVQVHLFGLPAKGALKRPFQSNTEKMLTELIAKVAPPPPTADTSVSSTATAEVMETSSPSTTSISATVTTADTTVVVEEEESTDDSALGILTCIHIYPQVVYVVYVTNCNSL